MSRGTTKPSVPQSATVGKPRKTAAAAALAAMLTIATPFVAEWEGTETKPYWDRYGKVWTVCTGETNVEMREYTREECAAILSQSLNKYAEAVAQASPGIENSPYEWAAHTSFAYNIGIAGYRRSSVSRLFNAGDRIGACRFMRNYKYAGGRVLTGLAYRREGEGKRIGESELCLSGAVPAQLGRSS